VSFDGEHVRGARQFARLVEETPPGRQVKASVLRQGSKMEIDVTPSAGEASGLAWRQRPERGWSYGPAIPAMPDIPDLREFQVWPAPGQGALGVGAQDLTKELAEYFGVEDGVLVNSVRPDSPAAKAGLKAGDVITSVDGGGVDGAMELRRRLMEAQSDEVTLGVTRNKTELSIKATLDHPLRATSRRRWSM
jgi:S1-C subfamily serine protease